MAYPPSSLTSRSDSDTATPNSHSADHTSERTAINDIVTELGTTPKGGSASLSARLTTHEARTTVIETHQYLAQSYLGYNTIGASWGTPSIDIGGQCGIVKKITTTAQTTVLTIDAYIRMNSAQQVGSQPGAFVFADNAGTPGQALMIQAGPSDTVFPTHIIAGPGTGRWFSASCGFTMAASTSYWLGVAWWDTGSYDIAYDTGGTDRTYSLNYFTDWIYDTGSAVTTTTRNYSLRFNCLS